MSRPRFALTSVPVFLAGLLALPLLAQDVDSSTVQTSGSADAAQPLDAVEVVDVPPLDLDKVELEDRDRELLGLPPRFAIPWKVHITPETHGTWQTLDEKTRLWRLRIVSPGAYSLNLGFTDYFMPHNGKLFVYASDHSYKIGPYTDRDNEDHGQLWTPVVLADDIVVEVTVPADGGDELELVLGAINHGYRGFGEPGGKSGWCNIDVVCPEGDDWRSEIRSVGVISTGGYLFCTGFMVNNTAQDQTPYFMTAKHCGVNSGNAASLVVYWNYESPTCGQQGGGSLNQNQTGSYLRAAYSDSDFTLVELDEDPNPVWEVTFAGWDNTGNNATLAVAIHHPSTDEKSISFEYDPTQTTSYLGYSSPGDGTHVRVIDWDLGTTEPGSSGSPLFDENHHVIGQLHGGYAACGNDESDWYGRFSTSWDGGGTSSTRLRNWLDPGSSGATSVDTLDPYLGGMRVTPADGLISSGDPGGPFTPNGKTYAIENAGEVGIDYTVTKSADWLTIINGSGYIAPTDYVLVTILINANAETLGVGTYEDTLYFTNTTNHEGDTTRPVVLEVGGPSLIYSWSMDADPGWATEGQWAHGQPTGGGGEYGYPDPTGGYTGSNVCGYNLNGDYANNLPERHLTTNAIDCTGLEQVSLRFWRWLGVERPTYDRAYIRVSTNGSNWSTIWENGVEITDNVWVQQEYDISDMADGQPTVYIRWTMGPTDGSWRYCGWNIDDVEVWALDTNQTVPGDLDGDGDVDFEDLATLLTNYGSTSGMTYEDGDIDGDGDVDLADLAILLSNYGYGP